jgi:hypothetical protein
MPLASLDSSAARIASCIDLLCSEQCRQMLRTVFRSMERGAYRGLAHTQAPRGLAAAPRRCGVVVSVLRMHRARIASSA